MQYNPKTPEEKRVKTSIIKAKEIGMRNNSVLNELSLDKYRIALQRAIDIYRTKGCEEEWIAKRIKSIQERKKLYPVKENSNKKIKITKVIKSDVGAHSVRPCDMI